MTRKKHISSLLLAVFSVILLHSFIPHHHHDFAMILQSKDHCSKFDHGHENEAELPEHCTSLNDLLYNKTGAPVVSVPFDTDHAVSICYDAAEESNMKLKGKFIFVPDKIPLCIQHAEGAYSLRAPPSFLQV